jgi:hypothetical protein
MRRAQSSIEVVIAITLLAVLLTASAFVGLRSWMETTRAMEQMERPSRFASPAHTSAPPSSEGVLLPPHVEDPNR